MTDEMRCPFCEREVTGLTSYCVVGVLRLFVCNVCYRLLIQKEHQPHSKPMQRLRRLLWGSLGKEVVLDEGLGRGDAALGHRPSMVAQEEAQHEAVSVAEPAVGFVTRHARVNRRTLR